MRSFRLILFSVLCMLAFGACKDSADTVEEEPVVPDVPAEPAEPSYTDKISYNLLPDSIGRQYFTKEKLHEQITPYFIDLVMKQANYPHDAWLQLSLDSIRPSTPAKQAYLDSIAGCQSKKLSTMGLKLPLSKPIDVIETSMAGFSTVAAFTAGTRIYINLKRVQNSGKKDNPLPNVGQKESSPEELMWHEVWHVLSRNNPELRRKMYSLIGFTILDEEIEIPAEVKKHILCNPDIERHDSYATFKINDKPTDCMLLFYAEADVYMPFTSLGNYTQTVEGCWLLALDPQTHKPYRDEKGNWAIYNCTQAKNFDEVMSGGNTNYCFDPEECMADNFAYAMMNDNDHPNKKLLQEIRDLFK